jgi:hypothetical protein
MSPPCQSYHVVWKRLADGIAVYPVGRLPPDGEWLLDECVRTPAQEVGSSCLYLDCADLDQFRDTWGRGEETSPRHRRCL